MESYSVENCQRKYRYGLKATRRGGVGGWGGWGGWSGDGQSNKVVEGNKGSASQISLIHKMEIS